MKLILGSSSKFRRQVFDEAGIEYEAMSPDIDEKKIRTMDHAHTPVVLSYAKALAVAEKVEEPAIIIACDQVVVCNGQILEKPENADEVRAWYKEYESYPAEFVNGLTVYNTETKASLTAQETSVATLRGMTPEFIDGLIEHGEIFQCAGAISNDAAAGHIEMIEGSQDSMIGLPLKFVLDMIERVK